MFGPALIPAAGHSVRMGHPKLLLPLGGQTILEGLLRAVREGGIERAIVVVRPDDEELAHTARRAGASVAVLPSTTIDMRATVVAGLDWIERRLKPAERRGFFLIPADHPVLSPAVFREIEAAIGRSGASIVVPTHAGRRGHPAWIAWSHVPALRTIPEGQGLNAYLRAQTADTLEVPWPSPEVLIDLDTPAEYEALARGNSPQIAGPTLITAAGQWRPDPPRRPQALLPGSFNPVHEGHWGLAAAARDILGHDVDFELSRRNVDKADLTDAEVARRAAQFVGRADLWVTSAPRFFEKAALFPGCAFVVGADTAARLVDARYHEGDCGNLATALDRLLECECRFLVAARVDSGGALLTLDDVDIPSRWRPMLRAIPATRFRFDLSSTDLRRREETR
jgi:CTP:molybdopterin cytidylyltransferase MocA